MSLAVKYKLKRLQELSAGIHLVIISDMKLLKDSKGAPVEKEGNNFICVKFTNSENKSNEQYYPVGTEKQRHFDLLITHIGLDNTKQVNKKETIGKRLWIAVKEVYFLDGDVTIKDHDGRELKDFYVFKTFKYDGENSYPIIKGDPKNFNGAAQDEFLDYKLVSDDFVIEKNHSENPMSNDKPSF